MEAVKPEMKKEHKLRFPEFDGEWQISRIENHYTFKNGLNKEKKYFGKGTPIINFADVFHLNSITKDDIKGLVELTEKEIANFSAKKSDVFFTRTSETINDIGKAAVLIEDIQDCVFSGFVLRARPKDGALVVDEFKKYCFSIEPVRKEIVTKSSFTTRALTSGTLLNKVVFKFPKSKAEQKKIAAFLSAVDKKIQQLTRKKKLLVQYKKVVMQKSFSQKLRFEDENGQDYPSWEEKRLGAVFEQRSEKGFKNSELLSVTINEGVKKRSEIKGKDNSSQDKSNYKRVLPGDLVYNSMRMWQGASGVSPSEGIVSPAYTVLKSNKQNSSEYFGYFFKMRKVIFVFQRFSQGLTSDTWNLKYPQLAQIKFRVPCLEEQIQIASFFEIMDNKIEKVTNHLTQTQQFKKGLLQQMFV